MLRSSDVAGAVDALAQGIDAGLHTGAQLAVSLGGRLVADVAIGEASPGHPMTTESMVTWFSMTKPTVYVCIARAWERGQIDLDAPIAAYVPEFGVNGKERVTVRHALTHTGGFRRGDRALNGTWDERVRVVCEAPLEPGWVVGDTGGYHLVAGVIILAECLRRIDGRPFERLVRDEVFEPLGMHDCWVGMPTDRVEGYRERLAPMHNAEGQVLGGLETDTALSECSPGGGGRGPMNQLVRMYEMLLGGGERDGVRLLSPQTVEAITARHRVDPVDKLFAIPVHYGLGFMLDLHQMGRLCSRRTFGHGGALSSTSLADPEHGLAVCLVTNRMVDPARHQERSSACITALYRDLGLASPDDPGRDKPLSKYA